MKDNVEMTVTASQVNLVVRQTLHLANEAIKAIQLEDKSTAGRMIGHLQQYGNLELGTAAKANVAILFVDVRGSTSRAKSLGPIKTYLTMHAFLSAMTYLVERHDGYIVGFRGDGLFAAFGLVRDGSEDTETDAGRNVQVAGLCGRTMIDAVEYVVNPALETYNVQGELAIGVGIDHGEVVITRIGLGNTYEITAYGDAVNEASKLSGSAGLIVLSPGADDLFPSSEGGALKTEDVTFNGRSGRSLVFPSRRLKA